MIDFGAIFGKMFAPIGTFFGLLFKCVFGGALLLIFGALVYFFVRYKFNPLKLVPDDLRQPYIRNKWLDLFRWLLVEAEQDPAKANPLEYAMKGRKYIKEHTGL